MYYTDENSRKVAPYIIHRTSIGCYERTLAYLLEKYAGALPLWLSAEQVKVMNIAQSSEDYAREVHEKLLRAGIRSVLDLRNEKIGYKIKDALVNKFPYMVIVGDGERDNGTISIRGRGNENASGLQLDDFIARLQEEIKNHK